jgi:hypothetical protein
MGPKDAQVSRPLQILAMAGSYVSHGDGTPHITRASAQKLESDSFEKCLILHILPTYFSLIDFSLLPSKIAGLIGSMKQRRFLKRSDRCCAVNCSQFAIHDFRGMA